MKMEENVYISQLERNTVVYVGKDTVVGSVAFVSHIASHFVLFSCTFLQEQTLHEQRGFICIYNKSNFMQLEKVEIFFRHTQRVVCLSVCVKNVSFF